MRVRLTSLLLRLLLCLAIVVNGIGGAQATARMAVMHMPAVTTMTNEARGMPPCHHPATHAAATASTGTHARASTAGHDDCCKDGRCDCPCAPSLPQLAAALQVPVVIAAATRDVAVPLPQHATPRLPHLIRPPIG